MQEADATQGDASFDAPSMEAAPFDRFAADASDGGPLTDGRPADADAEVDAARPADGADAPFEADVTAEAAPDGPDDRGAPADGVDGTSDGMAPDGMATNDTFTIVSSILGSACAACGADTNNADCFEPPVACESLSNDPGDAGGPSPAQSCADTLRCVLTSRCVEPLQDAGADPGAPFACYCGAVSLGACAVTPGPGVCRSFEETGFGTADPTVIVPDFTDAVHPAGIANYINLCLFQSCPSECFP